LSIVSSSSPETRKFLLIYTAPGKNPSYRRGVLDAICYPNGHLIPYSYRRKQIQPGLLQGITRGVQTADDPRLLIGKEAVIIFVDSDGKGTFAYFPLRRVRIYDVLPELSGVTPPSLNERIKLSLQLEDYVQYQDASAAKRWDELVQRFDVEREISENRPRYFVIGGEDNFAKCPHSPSIAWEDLVEAVCKSNGFPEAVFLRLGHLKGYGRDSMWDVHRKYEGDRLVYRLRPGQSYRLDLSIFENPAASASSGEGTSLHVNASATDSLVVDQSHQSFVSGLDERSALITCKRSIENVITTVSIRTEQEGVSRKIVNSPSPTLFVRIAVSWWVLLFFIICVFVGSFAVSIDTGLVKESWINDWPVTTTFVAKTIGAALLTLAAYLAFRRLPSGQR
jgi:hypothetical protein